MKEEKTPERMLRQHSMMVLSEAINCKLVVVGDSKSGKSALINAFLGKGYGEVSLVMHAFVSACVWHLYICGRLTYIKAHKVSYTT